VANEEACFSVESVLVRFTLNIFLVPEEAMLDMLADQLVLLESPLAAAALFAAAKRSFAPVYLSGIINVRYARTLHSVFVGLVPDSPRRSACSKVLCNLLKPQLSRLDTGMLLHQRSQSFTFLIAPPNLLPLR
jgi:hypothetical protein